MVLSPTENSRVNLVPDADRFLGKALSKLILIFLVPVLIFSELTIPLIFPLNFLLPLIILTSEPILTLEAMSDLKSVSISYKPFSRIEAKTFPLGIMAPT